jgi:hypothetical protein
MRLNPAATKASSNLKDVRSSTVQPKTFPPNASGATSNPELPKLRLLIFLAGAAISASREYPYQNAGELGFGWIFPMRSYALRQKLLYPERGKCC